MKYIEDEIPFEVPEGWAWSRFVPLTIKIGSGSTPTGGAAVYSESGVKFIRSQNVYNDGLVLNDIAYISEEINKSKSGSVVKPKDILLNITGGSIGRCALVPDDFDIANVNQHVMIIRLVELNFRKYIHNLITSEYFQSQILSRQIGSGRGGLSAETLSTFLIPVPPLKEQTRIGKKLNQCVSTIMTVAEGKASIAALIANTKSKILELAIQGQLVPQDPTDEPASVLLERIRAEKEELIKQGKIKRDKNDSVIFKGDDNSYYEKFNDGTIRCINEDIPFETPDTWMWCRLKSICTMVAGKAKPTAQIKLKPFEGCYECYGGNGVRGYVNEYNYDGTFSIVGRQGSLCGNINIASGKFYATEHAVVTTFYPGVNFYWSNYMLKALQLNKYATGAAQPGLSVANVLDALVPVPPYEEQQATVNTLKMVNSLLSQIAKAVA